MEVRSWNFAKAIYVFSRKLYADATARLSFYK